MRISNRGNTVSALAFIDVMACGLGAVILLFFIIDFDAIYDFDPPQPAPPVVQHKTTLSSRNSDQEVAQIKTQITQAEAEVAMLTSSLLAAKTKALEANIKKQPLPSPKIEVVETTVKPSDLFGLKIQGKNILVMLDTSASMSATKLADVIVNTLEPSGKRLAMGKKWATAKKVFRWAVLNAPEASRLKLLTFSEEAKIHNTQWQAKSQAVNTVDTVLATLKPGGGTNLGNALALAKNAAETDVIYLITDGLPTLKGKGVSFLSKLRNCKLRSDGYVSGACRAVYFDAAVHQFKKHSSAIVNVILLPLEGDPKAAPKFWYWAKSTGGMLFSPAPEWP